MLRIDPAIAEALGSYVYLYRDSSIPARPVIYVGRGGGDRVLHHLDGSHNPRLAAKIEELRALGFDDQDMVEVVRYGLTTTEAATIEGSLITYLWGSGHLLNDRHEYLPGTIGDMAHRLFATLRRDPVRIPEAGVIVFLESTWRRDMSADDMVRFARGYWHGVGTATRHQAKVLLAAAGGIIRGAWTIIPGSWREGAPIVGREGDEEHGRWSCELSAASDLAAYVGQRAPKGSQKGWRKTPI